jgi:hypothetical protein
MLVVLLYRRAIAYPFNAKQPNDMTKRHLKVTPEMLEKLRARVDVSLLFFYTGTSKISAGNQVLESFGGKFLGKSMYSTYIKYVVSSSAGSTGHYISQRVETMSRKSMSRYWF